MGPAPIYFWIEWGKPQKSLSLYQVPQSIFETGTSLLKVLTATGIPVNKVVAFIKSKEAELGLSKR